MASIGCLPTKNTIRITSDTGAHGTIQAATPSTAGCMSAEQAKQLEACFAAIQGGAQPTVIIEPAPDVVTRGEMAQALAQVRTQPVPQLDFDAIRHEIQAIASQSVPALPPPDDGTKELLAQAVASLNERLASIEAFVSGLQQTAAAKVQETAR